MSGLYGIIDTARDPHLHRLVKASPRHACLFEGNIQAPLDSAAPYLVELTDDTPLRDIWRNEGWGKAWGILLRSALPMKELRRHLRKFLMVQLPSGEMVYFRYYDPRVWRVYWPTCTPEEQAKWMAGVEEFVVEEGV